MDSHIHQEIELYTITFIFIAEILGKAMPSLAVFKFRVNRFEEANILSNQLIHFLEVMAREFHSGYVSYIFWKDQCEHLFGKLNPHLVFGDFLGSQFYI